MASAHFKWRRQACGIIFQAGTRRDGPGVPLEVGVFTLQRCLCNLLCRCLPGDRKASEGETVVDAPAPVDGQPAGRARQGSAQKQAGDGGRKTA